MRVVGELLPAPRSLVGVPGQGEGEGAGACDSIVVATFIGFISFLPVVFGEEGQPIVEGSFVNPVLNDKNFQNILFSFHIHFLAETRAWFIKSSGDGVEKSKKFTLMCLVAGLGFLNSHFGRSIYRSE